MIVFQPHARTRRSLVASWLVLLATLLIAATAQAYTVHQVPGFPADASINSVGVGGDGNIRVSDMQPPPEGGPNKAYLALISPADETILRRQLDTVSPDNGLVLGVAPGSAGSTWFGQFYANRVSRIAADGTKTDFALPNPNSSPRQIVQGSDGAMWFIENASTLGQIDSNGTLHEYQVSGSDSEDLVRGPDGNIWVANYGGDQVLSVSTSGQVTASYAVPSPTGITVGSDGNIWTTDSNHDAIYRIVPGGTPTAFSLPAESTLHQPKWIASGADGALWFTEYHDGVPAVGRMTTEGVLTDQIPTAGRDASDITAEADSIWIAENNPGGVGRINTTPPPAPSPAAPQMSTPADPAGTTAFPVPTVSGSVPVPSVKQPPGCGPVKGSLSKRLLASLECGVTSFALPAKCGIEAGFAIADPFKKLEKIKTATGYVKLDQVNGKAAKGAARLYNQLVRSTYRKTAPKGFRNFPQAVDSFHQITSGLDFGRKLYKLSTAINKADFAKFIDALVDISGVQSCVRGLTKVVTTS